MVNTTAEIIGYIAASLTTLSFVPQAVMVIRTRRTGGISILMYSMFVLGVAMWLVYGLMLGIFPIIVSNLITVLLAGTILFIASITRFSRRGTLQPRPPGEPLPPEQNPDLVYYEGRNDSIICENCGRDISPDSKICGFCKTPTGYD